MRMPGQVDSALEAVLAATSVTAWLAALVHAWCQAAAPPRRLRWQARHRGQMSVSQTRPVSPQAPRCASPRCRQGRQASGTVPATHMPRRSGVCMQPCVVTATTANQHEDAIATGLTARAHGTYSQERKHGEMPCSASKGTSIPPLVTHVRLVVTIARGS